MLFQRLPRRPGPQPPRGELVLEPPPELPEQLPRDAGRLLMAALPMVSGIGALAFLPFAGRGGGAMTWVTGSMFGVSMLSMAAGSLGGVGGEQRAKLDAGRRDYLRHLAQVRKRARRAAAQQRAAQLWRHPDPDTLWSVAACGRRWERRPTDDDFGEVRIAQGPQRLAVKIVTPDTKPVEDLEPITALALRRFVRAHSTVPNLPIAVNLRTFSRIVLRGDRDPVLDLARSMVCQLTTFHAPDDLTVAVVTAPQRRPEWEWVKWLPHAQFGDRTDAAGAVRLVVGSESDLESLLGDELTARPRHSPDAGPLTSGPHVIVVLDGGGVSMASSLLRSHALGSTVLDLSGVAPRDAAGSVCLDVSPSTVQLTQGRRTTALGRPDRITAAEAEGLARQLAPFRLSRRTAGDEPLSRSMELPDLLGVADAAAIDPRVTWRHRPIRDQLRVPLGLAPDGGVVELDVKEAALEGMGPHGLLVGATGSGKSELLRTLVAGLAVTHSPEELNFVLVDFKGGATFASLDTLPHTSAVITNLADELPLVDRMKDALAGEMVRRQEVLRAAGNFVNRTEYEKARLAGQPLEPLPSLLVICDEFSEMLVAKPDFIDLFLQVGRIGRSIGVHLLLASQRLEEGKLKGLDTYLSYRIGLRTFSALESRIVLGVPDAHELPQAPGHGYLKVGTESMLRFRAAYVSGPYRTPDLSRHHQTAACRQVVPFSSGVVTAPTPPVVTARPSTVPSPAPFPTVAPSPGTVRTQAPDTVRTRPQPPGSVRPSPGAPAEAGPKATTLEVIADRLRGQGRPAHQVWLPPLAEPPSLDELMPALTVDEYLGLHPAQWAGRGRLVTPIGVVDRPFEQRRDPLLVELDGAGGNVVVVGRPQSGKSTLLRSLLCSLALTHTSWEVQFYCLDFGGGALRGLTGLPHLSGVAGRRDTEVVRRIVAEVSALVDEREARFAQLGIDSIAAYRRRRATGEITDDPFGDVFLVVDGWATVRQEYEELEQVITNLAARGLGYGVHVVIAAARWAEVRVSIRDSLGTRLELRLGETNESEINRKAATNVPEAAPGRGLTKDGLHFLTAVSRGDGRHDVDDLAEATATLVSQIAAAWRYRPAPPVRLLPPALPVAELKQLVGPGARGIPIGLNETHLAPVYLDFADDPHLLVLGDGECGKTNLLRIILRSLVERNTPDQARLVIADYRRGLLGAVDGDHVLGYAPSGQTLSEMVAAARGALLNRIPGPDVTPDQLRNRSWWHGPELYFVVDDYDLVAAAGNNPVSPLLELLPQARDIGLHLIVTRRVGGASRALYEPILQRLRELDSPALLMSGNREEGALFGNLKPSPQPAGRGHLIRRRDGVQLIQTALDEAL